MLRSIALLTMCLSAASVSAQFVSNAELKMLIQAVDSRVLATQRMVGDLLPMVGSITASQSAALTTTIRAVAQNNTRDLLDHVRGIVGTVGGTNSSYYVLPLRQQCTCVIQSAFAGTPPAGQTNDVCVLAGRDNIYLSLRNSTASTVIDPGFPSTVPVDYVAATWNINTTIGADAPVMRIVSTPDDNSGTRVYYLRGGPNSCEILDFSGILAPTSRVLSFGALAAYFPANSPSGELRVGGLSRSALATPSALTLLDAHRAL